jgi:hypothetical protein
MYDEKQEDEYTSLFRSWNDVNYVMQFMEEHKELLNASVWRGRNTPVIATKQVMNEADGMKLLFERLNTNAKKGRKPDFDDLFVYLDGKYKYVREWHPMKSYGPIHPSMLRMYAIKMGSNIYLITGGGIKLSDSIQHSPDLKDHVIQNIDRVRAFLRENGIMDSDDL